MIKDKHISKNFKYEEIYVSRKFPQFVNWDLITPNLVMAAKFHANQTLEPIREHFGKIKVSSWIRTEGLNLAAKGSPNSDHLTGSASDNIFLEADIDTVFMWLYFNMALDLRQVVMYPDENFIHISTNNPWKPRKREFWTYLNGNYTLFKRKGVI